MKFERHKRAHSEVNAGALTDIMFFLLIFFLIVATTSNPNVIKLFLPQSAPSKEIAKNNVVVSISKDLNYYINTTKEPIPEDQLRGKIEEALSGKENRTIQLNVDRDVPAQYLVRVLDIGMRLNVRVVLATEAVK